jgi:hypothetical protein
MWSEPPEDAFKLCFSLVLFNARATYTPTITGLWYLFARFKCGDAWSGRNQTTRVSLFFSLSHELGGPAAVRPEVHPCEEYL